MRAALPVVRLSLSVTRYFPLPLGPAHWPLAPATENRGPGAKSVVASTQFLSVGLPEFVV